ncbi:MAG TPA: NUDIX hydrolase [Candidatus Saccharimonadales bacterium]|nr:NUDIX hydrolase [Candidatus Saccharimonadales bacterium]
MVEFRSLVKVLLVNDAGEVLLLRRSPTDVRRPGQWDMPGGNIDPGEDFLAALVRETQEEAGITIAPADLHHIYGTTKFVDNINITWNFFVTKVQGHPKVTLSFEHDDLQWTSPEKALQKIEYDLHKIVLGYALEHGLL